MKDLVLKLLVVSSLIAFVDYVIMIIVGCTSCLFGVTSNYYTCTFCTIGKIILIISILAIMIIAFYQIKLYTKQNELNKN